MSKGAGATPTPAHTARGQWVAKTHSDVYIEYFSLQECEIEYTFHLHYEKSTYGSQIQLEI